jgi:cell division protein FtsZ
MDTTRVHYVATIKVIGLGDSGAEIISRAIDSSLEGVKSILIHTDDRSLSTYDADAKIQLSGELVVKAGSLFEETIRDELDDADMIVLVAGEGDQPETRIAPIIGKIAKEVGILIAGVVTRRSTSEEPLDSAQVEEGVQLLREAADMMIMVPDETLLPGFFTALKGA